MINQEISKVARNKYFPPATAVSKVNAFGSPIVIQKIQYPLFSAVRRKTFGNVMSCLVSVLTSVIFQT